MLHKFMDEYASELSAARATEDFKRPFGRLVRQDIATYLQEKLDSSVYTLREALVQVDGQMFRGLLFSTKELQNRHKKEYTLFIC